ncbi:MAG TPA: carboxypeptidase-like regulatory domain-containing protein [Salegentibacter sp.]|uniref:carboxypeptidase-like regulatory domain-containing protein n=1 Tax=Salegentibacter sp. TaxID=1903072 RepID=UPI002F94648B
MKKLILILLILISNPALSQVDESDSNFREFKGKVIGTLGEPLVAQTVMIKGTQIGGQTDLDGNFCLLLPKGLTVYIEIPLLNYDTFREIKPTDESIVIELKKKQNKSSRVVKNWKKRSSDLTRQLQELYKSEEFKKADKKICR